MYYGHGNRMKFNAFGLIRNEKILMSIYMNSARHWERIKKDKQDTEASRYLLYHL